MSNVQSCSPFVQIIIENLVKFHVGEEYKLTSDITDILSDTTITYYTKTNLHQEYKDNNRTALNNFFRREGDTTIDDADIFWKENFLTRPYILTETHWTPDLNMIVSPLYKGKFADFLSY